MGLGNIFGLFNGETSLEDLGKELVRDNEDTLEDYTNQIPGGFGQQVNGFINEWAGNSQNGEDDQSQDYNDQSEQSEDE